MPYVAIDTEFQDAINGTVLVGARVYPLKFPQNPAYPVATYTRISAPRDQALDRTVLQTRTRFQVDVWDTSYLRLRQAADQIRAAILAFYGTTVNVFGLGLENESDSVNPDNGVHQTTLEVVVNHG